MSADHEHPFHDAGWTPLMPFVVVKEHGGPFDAESFSAGYECGNIMRMLDQVPPEVPALVLTVRTANVPQIDMFAMHHGWLAAAVPYGEEAYWSVMELTRGGVVLVSRDPEADPEP
jgi:hypothetical protein